MRLWSIHPKYLDPQGLVALWREALLAQAVLAGLTKGYHHHPQLIRFAEHHSPLRAIGTYLHFVVQEAQARGYSFNDTKILQPGSRIRLTVSTGQIDYEFSHLHAKLRVRSPHWPVGPNSGQPHPMFKLLPGPVATWERVSGS